MLEPVRSQAVSPDRAWCLRTLSHFMILNKTSLSPTSHKEVGPSYSIIAFITPPPLPLPPSPKTWPTRRVVERTSVGGDFAGGPRDAEGPHREPRTLGRRWYSSYSRRTKGFWCSPSLNLALPMPRLINNVQRHGATLQRKLMATAFQNILGLDK
jgi:hypothetical protein